MDRSAAVVVSEPAREERVAPPAPTPKELRVQRAKLGVAAATIGAPIAVISALLLSTASDSLRAPGLLLFLLGLGLTSGGHFVSSRGTR